MAPTSFLMIRINVAIFVLCLVLCLSTTTPAASARNVEEKMMMTMEKDSQGQPRQRYKRETTRSNCARPAHTEVDLLYRQFNSELSGQQFLQPAVKNQSITSPDELSTRMLPGPAEAKTCPTSLTRNNSAPVSQRSSCPYYYDILQLPEGYFPSTLLTARCKCQRCVEHNAHACEQVLSRVAVLKPVGCLQGMQKYEEQTVEVSVACTCVA